MALEEPVQALLKAKNFVHIATRRADGTTHLVPVWVDTDGEHVIVNGALTRAWVHNLERDPRATLTVMNLENPYEFVEIQGRMVDKTTDGADDHIDTMAKKYFGVDEYPYRSAQEQRLVVRFTPDEVRHRVAG